jgi:hypothetical protein
VIHFTGDRSGTSPRGDGLLKRGVLAFGTAAGPQQPGDGAPLAVRADQDAGSLCARSVSAALLPLPATLLPGPFGPHFPALGGELQPAPGAQGAMAAGGLIGAAWRSTPPAGSSWELAGFAQPIDAGAFGDGKGAHGRTSPPMKARFVST